MILSEIWSYNIQLYQNLFPCYVFYYESQNIASNVGGVGIFVKSCLSHSLLDYYKINSNDVCEFVDRGDRILNILLQEFIVILLAKYLSLQKTINLAIANR